MRMVLMFGLHKTQHIPSVVRRLLGFVGVSAPYRYKGVRIKLAVTLKIEAVHFSETLAGRGRGNI